MGGRAVSDEAAALTAKDVAGTPGAAATTEPAARRVILVGANPGVSLFDGDRLTAFASVWDVRWSERGSGRALVLWHDDQVRVVATDPELGYWLSQYFTRNFPEVSGVAWPEPIVERAEVVVEFDLASGLYVRASDVSVRMDGVLHRRIFATDDFVLAGVPHSLSNLFVPMRTAQITAKGRLLPGTIRLGGTPERPWSSAFIADAEVWRV